MELPEGVREADARMATYNHAGYLMKQLLGLVANTDELKRLPEDMKLIRDKSEDRSQHERFASKIRTAVMYEEAFSKLTPPQLNGVIDIAYDEIIGISVLGPLWREDAVTEILVDGYDSVSVEFNGQLHRTNLRFESLDHAKSIASKLAQKVSDRALTPANPLVTAELPRARVTFAVKPVVKSEISISMRKFPPLMNMDALQDRGAFSQEMRDFLTHCVQARANVLVSGGTGTGKTTFINGLSESIPDSERVITIEDSYELKIGTTHWVAMQTKEAASSDDEVSIGLADLLRNTLRMRPDRVIVGEIREGAGAQVMLQAANTGHDGTMTTIHANSADRALNFRLAGLARDGKETPAEVAVAEVSSAIDLVVQVARENGIRFVKEIAVCDPTLITGAQITPVSIFVGRLEAQAGQEPTPVFERVGDVPEDSQLAIKLISVVGEQSWVQTSPASEER